MNLPRSWPFLAIAGAALAVAVYAGPNQRIATALAGVALVAIGFLLIAPIRTALQNRRPSRRPSVAEPASTFRAALESGRSGRSEVVAQLDLVERRTVRPDRPATPSTELSRLRGLTRAEFRSYVSERLDAIEGAYR
jgi:hypothetical protein